MTEHEILCGNQPCDRPEHDYGLNPSTGSFASAALPQEQPRWRIEDLATKLRHRDYYELLVAWRALEADLKALRAAADLAQGMNEDTLAELRADRDALRTELDTAKVNLDLMRPVVNRALAEDVFFERDRLRIENETLRAKAALAEEIGIAGYRHAKEWWQNWLARYDALTPPETEKEQQDHER